MEMDRSEIKQMGKQILVIKIGSSTLTRGQHIVSRGKIEDLARQILELQKDYQVVLVSSGAIATARQSLHLSGRESLAIKQALAAIGQPMLMRIYQEVFADYHLRVAQCLLSHHDFEAEGSRKNIVNTLKELLDHQCIPIINENDTTATEEIKFGDNDRLAARVAVLLQADRLILASDINGLYTGDPRDGYQVELIPEVHDLSSVIHMAGEGMSAQGSGGMRSKLQAAAICQEAQIEMWIVNGGEERFILRAMNQEIPFTRFPNKLISSSQE